MRKLLIVAAIGLAFVLSLALSASSASAAECPSQVVCVYTETGFHGAVGHTECSATGFHPLAGKKHSVANACTFRPVFLRYENAYTGLCLPPLTSDANVTFDEIRIGEPGSHC